MIAERRPERKRREPKKVRVRYLELINGSTETYVIDYDWKDYNIECRDSFLLIGHLRTEEQTVIPWHNIAEVNYIYDGV